MGKKSLFVNLWPSAKYDNVLNVQDDRLIILCGVSGSGKTTLARRMETEGFKIVSSDELIWKKYGERFSSLPFPEKKAAFQCLGTSLLESVTRYLEAGERVVVDATNCKRKKRDALYDICRAYGVKPLVIYLKVPYNILLERLSARKGIGPHDQMVTEEQLQGFLANFEEPTKEEQPLVIWHS